MVWRSTENNPPDSAVHRERTTSRYSLRAKARLDAEKKTSRTIKLRAPASSKGQLQAQHDRRHDSQVRRFLRPQSTGGGETRNIPRFNRRDKSQRRQKVRRWRPSVGTERLRLHLLPRLQRRMLTRTVLTPNLPTSGSVVLLVLLVLMVMPTRRHRTHLWQVFMRPAITTMAILTSQFDALMPARRHTPHQTHRRHQSHALSDQCHQNCQPTSHDAETTSNDPIFGSLWIECE